MGLDERLFPRLEDEGRPHTVAHAPNTRLPLPARAPDVGRHGRFASSFSFLLLLLLLLLLLIPHSESPPPLLRKCCRKQWEPHPQFCVSAAKERTGAFREGGPARGDGGGGYKRGDGGNVSLGMSQPCGWLSMDRHTCTHTRRQTDSRAEGGGHSRSHDWS